MAIAINTSFHVGAALPLDDRAYLTKAEMLTIDENIYPDYFLAVCADDGFLYMFDKNMDTEDISAETGKFKLFAGDVDEAIRILNADEDTENSVRYWIKQNAANALYDTKEVVTYTIAYEGGEAELSSAELNAVVAGEPKEIAPGLTLKYDEENTQFLIVNEDGDETPVVPTPNTVTANQTIKEKIEEIEDAAKVEITVAEEATEGYLKTYIVTQGDEEVGQIDIPKDLVVESGSITKIESVIEEGEIVGYKVDDDTEITYTADDVVDEESDYYGYPLVGAKYIKLVIANQKAPIFIDIKEIMPEGAGETTEDIIANIEVGGIADGDIIPAGTDLQEFITKLVVKYFPPTISLTSSVTNTVQRVGTVLNDVVLTANVGKKSLDVTGVTIDGTDMEDVAAEGGSYDKTIATIDDSVVFTASATDGQETTTTKFEYKFVYPYMHGVADSVDAIDLDDLTEVVELKGSKTFSYTAGNQYCVFAMPSSYADLTSILDPSSFENLKSFTKTTMTNAAGESYKVYYTNTPVTCTNFKYTFK